MRKAIWAKRFTMQLSLYRLTSMMLKDQVQKKLEDLHTDKEGLERFAREEYFMKRPNEDVYIIKDE